MDDDNGGGAVGAEERGSSPTEPAAHRVRFIDGHTNIEPSLARPCEEPIDEESNGPDPEDSPGGAFTPDYVVIPSHCRTIIESVCKEDWGVDKPREFQVQAIFQGAMSHGSFMSITAKTGYGKSLVHLAIASMRRGVSIVMVPLLGLGTDQVAKAIHQDKNILAWHVDEFKGNDAKLLRKSLYRATADDMAKSSTILFMSPRSLAPDSDMIPVLTKIAKSGFLSLICVDEAHTVHLHGDDYRPEFPVAMRSLKELYDLQPNATKRCPRIVMSATFRSADKVRCNQLWDAIPDWYVHTDNCRRRVFIDVASSGNPTKTCRTCIKLDLKENPNQKIIWYTNSKKKAEESLVPSAESVMDEIGMEGEAMACTGGCGLAEKAFMLAAFRGDTEMFSRPEREELRDAIIDDEMCEMPNQVVLPATAAANAGISSNHCHHCYRNGPPPNLYDLVQEMGRTDRDRSLPPGWNRFELHVSWDSAVSMFVRIMQHKDGDERERQLVRFFQLMQFIFTLAARLFIPSAIISHGC